MPKKKIRAWSNEELESLDKLLSQNVSIRAIAIILNRTKDSIQYEIIKKRLNKMELKIEFLMKKVVKDYEFDITNHPNPT